MSIATRTKTATNKQDSLQERLQAALVRVTENVRYEYGLLAGVILLAALLRFYRLGEWSFWIDEIFTIYVVQDPLVTYDITWPRLSLMLISETLKLLGLNEWSARLAPALIGIISIPILYFPIRRMFGQVVALIAMLLLAVAPWHLYWSQNARFYTSLLLLYTLAAFAFFLAIEEDRPRYFLLFFLLLFLAMVERMLALFLIPVVVCYLLLLQITPFAKPPGFRTRNLLLLLLPGIAAALFDLCHLATTGASHLTDTLETFGGKSIDDPFRLLSFIAFNMGVPLMCLAFFGGTYLFVQKSRAGLFVFVAAVVPVVLLLLASPFVFTKDRYIFLALPYWIILASIAVKVMFSQLQNQGKLLAIGVLFMLLAHAASEDMLYYTINGGNRRDWKDAFALILARREADDVVVSTRPEIGRYYLDHEVKWMGDVTPDSVRRSGQRFWFVADSESVWVTGRINSWVEENGVLIDVQYLRVPEDISLRIYLYDPAYHSLKEDVNVLLYNNSDH